MVQHDNPTVGRVAGPYDLRTAMQKAESLAEEATQVEPDTRETRELDALDLMEVIGDTPGVFGSVDASSDEPACLYFVKEIHNV